MSKREPSVLLDDIHTSIEKIQRYTAGLDESSFRTSVQSIPLAPFSGTHLTIQRFNVLTAAKPLVFIRVHSWLTEPA